MPTNKPTQTPDEAGSPDVCAGREPWSAGARLVYLTTKHPPLTGEELADTLGKLGADSPVARAIWQLLNMRAGGAMADVAGARMSDTERAHAAGRLEELLGLLAEVQQLVNPQRKGGGQ